MCTKKKKKKSRGNKKITKTTRHKEEAATIWLGEDGKPGVDELQVDELMRGRFGDRAEK